MVSCRTPDVSSFENHYEGREREPERTEWGDWFRAPHNTLRTYTGGQVEFPVSEDKRRPGYEVDLDRCATNEDAWHWIHHIAKKNWASRKFLKHLEDALFDLGCITGFPTSPVLA